MAPAPERVGGERVICYTPIDSRHRPTGGCRQYLAGVLQGPAAGLAICEPGDKSCFSLFGCDENWNSITDTSHFTPDDAFRQAEFEYAGVTETWVWRVERDSIR